jgi:hypothetical protein
MVLRLCGRGQVREWVGDMIASAPPAKPLANMSGTATTYWCFHKSLQSINDIYIQLYIYLK